ncbi:MAG: SAM-dependent methyltransferase [Acidimicrobiia bacterium]|nr:SAM-dependent methyltransferase [Acidimicrobiia bacterium]
MRDRIVTEIEATGPMRFDRFMELSLYDPEAGFFAVGALRSSADGDFVTSPEVSPWFGRLIGRWAKAAKPTSDSILVEVGAGSGSLLAPMIAEAGDAFAAVYAVEISPGARASIAERALGATILSNVDEIPSADAVIVANELIDNLPARLVERDGDSWREVRIDLHDGRLSLSTTTADPDLSAWCDRMLGRTPDGSLLAAQTQVPAWIVELARRFATVQIALIDYGGDTETLARHRRSDVVRSFRRHVSVDDPLRDPGRADITVDVNTDVVIAGAAEAGLTVEVIDQRSWLRSLGADRELEQLVAEEHARARQGDTMGQLEIRSEAVGLRTLMDPHGFGAFQVMLLSSAPSAPPLAPVSPPAAGLREPNRPPTAS